MKGGIACSIRADALLRIGGEMQQSPPGLLPLFRSETQLAVLGALFTERWQDWQLTALAKHLGLGVSTVSREVARLQHAGIVHVHEQGRNKLVSANWDLPWAEPLAALLDRTIGPLAQLADALS
jgi:DNA-binding transcriptional ArsR family regulator